MKKIISILCILALLVPVTFAETDYSDLDKGSKYYEAVALFESMGLISGFTEDEFMPEVAMTRADFAMMFASLTGYDNSAYSLQRFSDVDESSPAFSHVNYMYENGYMLGDGDGTFRPNDGISCTEALKVVLTALGYDEPAKRKGGYPAGYNSVGAELKLTQGIDMNPTKPLTRGDMCILMYQALDTPMFTMSEITDKGFSYSEEEGATLLSEMMGVEKYSGVFIADYKSAVYGTRTNRADIVVINYETYSCTLNTENLVGKYVDYYVNSDNKVVAVFDRSESVVNVKYDDISPDSDLNEIKYDDGKREKRIKLSSDTLYGYNGIGATELSNNIVKPSYGEITAVDFDGDEVYDSVIVWEYSVGIVKSVSPALEQIQLESGELFDSDTEIFVYKNGASASFTDIGVKNVLLIAKAGSTVTVFVSDTKISGIVSSVDYDELIVAVEDVEYPVAAFEVNKIFAGKEMIIYTDKYGCIVYSEDDSGIKYGYLQNVYINEDTEQGMIKLFGQDGKFHLFTAAENVNLYRSDVLEQRIPGEDLRSIFYDGDQMQTQLIKYELNSKGEVINIYRSLGVAVDEYGKDGFVCNMNTAELVKLPEDDPARITSEVARYYSGYFYVVEKQNELSFLTSPSTVVFYLPEKETDWMIMSTSQFSVGQEFPSLAGYDFSYDGLCGCVVLKATGAIATSFGKSQTMFVVDELYTAVNDDNELFKVIGGISYKNERVSFRAPIDENIVSGSSEATTKYFGVCTDDIKKGDVIQVIADSENIIKDFRMIYSYGGDELAYSLFPDSEGNIHVLDREKSSMAYSGPLIGVGESAFMLKNSILPKTRSYLISGTKVTIFNTKKNRAEIATTDDIYEGVNVFAYCYPAYTEKFLVLYTQ